MKTRDAIQNNVGEVISQYTRCSIEVSMRVGKTKIALERIKELYYDELKVLVVMPKKKIKDGWLSDIEKFGYSYFQKNIEFSTYASLNKKAGNEYHLVIFDEVHSITERHLLFLDTSKAYFLGLTGTRPKNRDKVQIIQEYMPFVHVYSIDDAVGDKILNDYKIIVHMVPLSDKKDLKIEMKNGKSFMTSEAASYRYMINRNYQDAEEGTLSPNAWIYLKSALKGFKSKEEYLMKIIPRISKKTILFANTKDQADRLSFHSYHSSNPNSDENLESFKCGDSMLLSCVEQLSEGVTIPDLKQGFVMTADKEPIKLGQKAGRMLGLNPEDKATIHILCYEDTVEYDWLLHSLEQFNPLKIHFKKYNI